MRRAGEERGEQERRAWDEEVRRAVEESRG